MSRMKVRRQRDSRAGVSVEEEMISMEGGMRSGLRSLRRETRASSLERERPATAHLRVVGRWVVMCWAVYLPV